MRWPDFFRLEESNVTLLVTFFGLVLAGIILYAICGGTWRFLRRALNQPPSIAFEKMRFPVQLAMIIGTAFSIVIVLFGAFFLLDLFATMSGRQDILPRQWRSITSIFK